MKIAIIGSRGYPYVYSGYETFIQEVAPLLKERGVEVHVYCHKQLFTERPAEMNGIKLHYVKGIQTKSLSQWSNSFLSTVHSLFCGYDIILYVNSANGIFGPLTKLFRQKTAINVDGIEWLRPKWKGWGAKVFYFSSKMATRWMDVIITDAEAMRDIYLKEFRTDSIVIAYGATTSYSTSKELIKQWNLEINDYYLIVGRLIPDNNADLIVSEFIKSKSIKKLVVVGDVPYRDSYAEKIKNTRDKRLIFTGYVKDQAALAELYLNCFGYFHGHEFGGTNPALLKALAYGCGVIALDTVFSREVLADGKYGIFFSKGEMQLANLIDEIENNPGTINRLRNISRNRIIENYTWDKIANQYFELFQRMLSV